jgi:hypothetical protein
MIKLSHSGAAARAARKGLVSTGKGDYHPQPESAKLDCRQNRPWDIKECGFEVQSLYLFKAGTSHFSHADALTPGYDAPPGKSAVPVPHGM